MKRCSCCRKLLPETAFHKYARMSDGLNIYCKKCRNAMRQGAKVDELRPAPKVLRSLTGGLKIAILNHPKSYEFKYSIYDTDAGQLFTTNDNQAFSEKLSKLLEAI